MAFDIETSLRRTRAALSVAELPKRGDGQLTFVDDMEPAGGPVLLDSCVYIDNLQGRTPAKVSALLAARQRYHSSLCLGELSFLFGRLDPDDPRTSPALEKIATLLGSVSAHRIIDPTASDLSEGAIRAGVLSRVPGLAEAARKNALLDAVLAAQAVSWGAVLVTGNIGDFDRLSQLDPRLNVVFYRKK